MRLEDPLTYFPYKPRPHQREVIEAILGKLGSKNICLHAPTGFGKTPVILASLIPYILDGYRVIWAVRTGNETDRPIEELRVIVEKFDLPIFGISYRGKRDMCLYAEKFSEELDHMDVSYICSTVKNECEYYLKFKKEFSLKHFPLWRPLTYSEIFHYSRELGFCPYYVQRALARRANFVSMSYNYIVDPRFEWSIKPLIPFKNSILVVDEAHNLQNIELNSDSITLRTVRRAMGEAKEINATSLIPFLEHVEGLMIEIMSKLREDEDAVFNPLDIVGIEDLTLLQQALEYGNLIRRMKLKEGRRPRSSLHHFADFMLSALSLIDVDGVSFIAERTRDNLRLSIWDMRASEVLRDRWSLFYKCIFCSGTLEPIDAFAETIGLSNYDGISVPNIYSSSNVKIYILTGVTTRGEELSNRMAKRYVKSIANFLRRVKVNAAIFTSSYRVQDKLIEQGLVDEVRSMGFKDFIEHKDMSGPESRSLLEEFKSVRGRGVLIAPMSGRFAEGADFPGEELQAIYLVGIPFERPSIKTSLYISYYTKLYGEGKGRLYAYTLPAIRRAAQALGRAIRSLDDRAVLVLGDERYLKYMNLLPDYIREYHIILPHDRTNYIKPPWGS